ncbi:L,D-transpeptidase [Pseudorhodoplanes sinuspersici]|uniref:L,D-TPase catalytic domain-containing protein n=1 Tax=Pseudorhodoplanes sinuspersici TaxID=1235591 RepID=A0A1W6ZMV6_9HYPH|nr:L,D-transpeptidase [Pseudorhodoplanes sinuspersici]ARP98738.1 hypothetical protein CAK95_06360 [Pseudorhodoplanes sinuspersici]RKE69652.1 lipoprotein-anchoring transpeptidase ErfK/SrfK [Pseudorhodoplanes sinuspersici]
MQSKSVFSRLQKAAHFSSINALALVCLTGSTVLLPEPAEAQSGFFYYRQPEPYGYGYPPEMGRRADPYARPVIRQRVRPAPAKKTAVPGPGKQKEIPTPPGPHLLVVSIKSQRAALYANGKLVMESPVSSGTPTHPTPTGIFSVIQKNRHHRSNIYSDAPMPYMQRLTWSGIALHQGVLPGRPASHGCIRLPEQFASFLWRTTKLGARVVVSREDTAPYDIAHAKLFQPKPAPTTVETEPPLRRTLDTTMPVLVRTAGMGLIETGASARHTHDETAAPTAEPTKESLTASLSSEKADIPDAILDSFAQSLQAKQKKASPSGPISVFISRKQKQLYVRQGFIPLFTAPVTIRDEQAIVGTHVLTAYNRGDDSKELRWMAVTLPAELPRGERSKNSLQIDSSVRIEAPAKHARSQAKEPDQLAGQSIVNVLDRIDIPQDVIDRVSEYITAGASLIISDHGLGKETGLYTDFIVETH